MKDLTYSRFSEGERLGVKRLDILPPKFSVGRTRSLVPSPLPRQPSSSQDQREYLAYSIPSVLTFPFEIFRDFRGLRTPRSETFVPGGMVIVVGD